jgi:hypothetical protein
MRVGRKHFLWRKIRRLLYMPPAFVDRLINESKQNDKHPGRARYVTVKIRARRLINAPPRAPVHL